MKLFSDFFASSDSKNLKAPPGLAYKVTSIAVALYVYDVTTSTKRYVVKVHDYEVTEAHGLLDTKPIAVLATYSGAGNTFINWNNNNQVVDINHITKYIGISVTIDEQCSIWLTIYGELVKMSPQDEIWEFVGKAIV